MNKYSGPKGLKLKEENDTALFWLTKLRVCMLNHLSRVPLCVTLWTIGRQAPLHGTLLARILEWVAMRFSRGSSQPRDQTQVSYITGGHVPTAALILINLNIHICVVIPYWIVHI